MVRAFKKLIYGNYVPNDFGTEGVLQRRVRNIKAIWNNERSVDIGIERIVRLFLAMSQLVFLGTYLKHYFEKKGSSHRDVAVDVFVMCKAAFPVGVLYFGFQHNQLVFCILLWFMFETLLYVPTLIFASDIFSRPRSYGRSMLLLFFNYLEIVFDFGAIYGSGHYLNRDFVDWFDPIYFSFVTSATIGYGDFHPITTAGKALISSQTLIFVVFVVLFLNYFTNKVENKGYFNAENKD